MKFVEEAEPTRGQERGRLHTHLQPRPRTGCSASQPLPGAQGAPPVSLQRVLGMRTHGQGVPGLVAGDSPHTQPRGTETRRHPQVAVVTREHPRKGACLSGRRGRDCGSGGPAREAGQSCCETLSLVKRTSEQVPPAPETCGEGRGPAHFTPRPRTTSAGSRNGEWPARSTWDFCDSLKWSQKQSGSFWAGEVSSHTRTPKQRVTFTHEQAKHTPRAGRGGMAPGSELTHHNPVPSQSLRSAALVSSLFLPDSHACSL